MKKSFSSWNPERRPEIFQFLSTYTSALPNEGCGSSQSQILLFFGYCKPNCIQHSWWGTWLATTWPSPSEESSLWSPGKDLGQVEDRSQLAERTRVLTMIILVTILVTMTINVNLIKLNLPLFSGRSGEKHQRCVVWKSLEILIVVNLTIGKLNDRQPFRFDKTLTSVPSSSRTT